MASYSTPQGPVAPAAPHLEAQAMRIPKSVSDQAMQEDRYYGHRQVSEAIERMIMALFSCSHDSMAATMDVQKTSKGTAPRLSHFVAYALYRTRLPMAVVYFALLLLKRLKTQYPVARGSSGHRLFISAFMLASKMLCDDAYNNKSWVIVSQNLFSLHEVNQMERELFMYLDLDLRASPEELASFASELEMYGTPHVTLEDLKRTRLSSSTLTSSPTISSSVSRSPGSKSVGTPTSAPRRKVHRRCLSLRPDYWTHTNSNFMPTARHYRSESNEWSASGMQRLSRSCARASLPSQRSVPSIPTVTAPGIHHTSSSSSTYAPRLDSSFSPSMPWSTFYSTANASTMSITTPNSMGSSLRPTPSTSLSELSLNSPNASMYSTMPASMYGHHGWDHAKHVPAYEVNESFRMQPLAQMMQQRDAI